MKRMAELNQEPALVEATLRELEKKRREQRAKEQRAFKAMFKGMAISEEKKAAEGGEERMKAAEDVFED